MSFSDFSICSPKISRLAEKSFPLTMCFQNCPWCWHVLSLKGCGAWTVRPKWSTIHTNSPQPGCSYWVYQLISVWWFQNSVSQNVSQKKKWAVAPHVHPLSENRNCNQTPHHVWYILTQCFDPFHPYWSMFVWFNLLKSTEKPVSNHNLC